MICHHGYDCKILKLCLCNPRPLIHASKSLTLVSEIRPFSRSVFRMTHLNACVNYQINRIRVIPDDPRKVIDDFVYGVIR